MARDIRSRLAQATSEHRLLPLPSEATSSRPCGDTSKGRSAETRLPGGRAGAGAGAGRSGWAPGGCTASTQEAGRRRWGRRHAGPAACPTEWPNVRNQSPGGRRCGRKNT